MWGTRQPTLRTSSRRRWKGWALTTIHLWGWWCRGVKLTWFRSRRSSRRWPVKRWNSILLWVPVLTSTVDTVCCNKCLHCAQYWLYIYSLWLAQQEHLYCSWVWEFLSSKATLNICVFYWQDDISGDYRNVILALVVGGPPPNNASKCKPSPPIWLTYKLSNTVLLLN